VLRGNTRWYGACIFLSVLIDLSYLLNLFMRTYSDPNINKRLTRECIENVMAFFYIDKLNGRRKGSMIKQTRKSPLRLLKILSFFSSLYLLAKVPRKSGVKMFVIYL
jgi:hypothetical protein